MQAAVLRGLGNLPRAEEFPDPVPGDGEVLVRVSAAALKSVDKQLAAGTHFASPREFPVVCGIDGVGRLEDGSRIFFGGPKKPFGAMAELTIVRRAQCFPVPAELDDIVAAALPNPGVSAWLSLKHTAKLAAGETVLILGATGVTGRLAAQIAKILGAGRVVAAGRDPDGLNALRDRGVDSVLSLNQSSEDLIEAFRREWRQKRFDVVIDYLWGRPTEALFASLTAAEFSAIGAPTRLVQVGESAGPTIALPAAVLRSSSLTIQGTAGIPPWDVLTDAFQRVMNAGARGELSIDTERVPLADIESVWSREVRGRRLVVVP
jgi:NADPH2:quinone reductase